MGHIFFFLCACGSDGLILPLSLRRRPHRLSQFLSPCTSYLSWRRTNSVSLYLRISIPLAPFIVTSGSSLCLLCIAHIFSSPSPSLCGYVFFFFFPFSVSQYRQGFFLERENVKQSLNCKLEWVWILIGKYGLGFKVCLFLFSFFCLWISSLVFFIRVCVFFFCFWVTGLASERESFRRIVRIFKRITLYMLVFEGGIFADVSTTG